MKERTCRLFLTSSISFVSGPLLDNVSEGDLAKHVTERLAEICHENSAYITVLRFVLMAWKNIPRRVEASNGSLDDQHGSGLFKAQGNDHVKGSHAVPKVSTPACLTSFADCGSKLLLHDMSVSEAITVKAKRRDSIAHLLALSLSNASRCLFSNRNNSF